MNKKILTREEFIDKYGSVLVLFDRYYKYDFTFIGYANNGDKVVVRIGGDTAEDIYRREVKATEKYLVEDMFPTSGCVYRGDNKIEEYPYQYSFT